MKYFLEVYIEPTKHYIHVKGRIENAKDNSYYLNENFIILDSASKGEKINFFMDKTKPHPVFDVVSRPITFYTSNDEFAFEYEGNIPEIIDDINQIDEDIVELAVYSGWYPKPKDFNEVFDFELKVKMPTGYEIASNGKCIDYENITSLTKENDIVIFASNAVERYEYIQSNIKCTFLCPSDMLQSMEQRAKDIKIANELFSQNYGELSINGNMTEITTVLRPRGGWGYKRGNATFISAEWGRKEKEHTGDFHEFAHAWWCISNVTTNDWINEGGAEFSAFTAAKSIYGDDYAQKYISSCIDKIAKSDCKISIVDTDYKSEYRFLNHYIKATMMYIKAQQIFGENKVFDLLKKLFKTYQNTRNATTSAFLSLCDNDMKKFFEEYLFTSDWNELEYKI